MDKALKQRLVGATVLIALAVVVLPMLLSGQPDGQQEARRIEVPPKPSELSFETRRFPLGEEADGQPVAVVPPVVQDTLPAASTTTRKQDTLPATATPPIASGGSRSEAENRPSPAEGEPEASLPGRYLVQVASFSTTSNANRLSARLEEDGMAVLMDTVEAAVGILYRVRVGPFDQVGEAQAALAQIRARTPDVNPRIIDLRPDESAPVTDPSDPLVRWVVQVGSFSDQENAQSLVGRLRTAGFSAYVVTVNDSSGTRFKVRVGPEVERQSAVRVAAEIRRRMEIDGIVMSVD